jgi:hypothetical protein
VKSDFQIGRVNEPLLNKQPFQGAPTFALSDTWPNANKFFLAHSQKVKITLNVIYRIEY